MNTPLQIQVRKPDFFKRRYEFCIDEKVVAVLEYEKSFGRKAIATIDNRRWIFNRVGFWKPYLEITAEQSPYTKTHLNYSWNFKTEFRAGDGKNYFLKQTSYFRSGWTWLDENKTPVIEIRSKQLSRSKRGIIVLHQPENKELYLMMLIGWGQIIKSEDNAASAA
jgi:hypothetical protein